MTSSENTAHARRELGSGLAARKVHIITMKKEDKYFDTVNEAAEFMGVAKGTISRWANGSRSYEGKARLVEYL
jgi:transcriptional regulator with XRE-family HTH domain